MFTKSAAEQTDKVKPLSLFLFLWTLYQTDSNAKQSTYIQARLSTRAQYINADRHTYKWKYKLSQTYTPLQTMNETIAM